MLSVTDPATDTAIYGYDPVGNLSSVARQPAGQLSLLQFTPRSGSAGSQVVLAGTGFSSDPSQDQVAFNGTPASVIGASATELVVTVPSGASSGPISVTVGSATVTSGPGFTVGTAAGPVITGFSPSTAAVGASFTITGTGFDPALPSDVVSVNGTRASVTSASATSITATVGPGATTGRIRVDTPDGTATSTSYLFAPPQGNGIGGVSQTGTIAPGQTVTVNLAGNTSVALLGFDGHAGDRISVSGYSSLGGDFWLMGPNGQAITPEYSNYFPSTLGAVTLPNDGVYSIVARDLSVYGGTATLTLNVVPADPVATATTDGSSVTIATTVAGQLAHIRFSGTAGHRISIQSASSNTLYYVRVYAPDGTLLINTNDASPGGGVAWIEPFTLPSTGTYEIVLDPNGGVLSWSVNVWDVPPDPVLTATTDGTSVSAATTAAGQNVEVSFAADAGQAVSFRANGANTYFQARLLNPDGSVLVANQVAVGAKVYVDPVTLPSSGTYTLVIDPMTSNTGTYSASVWNVPADASASAPGDGSTVGVANTVPGQNARITFVAAAGQTASASIAGSTNNYNYSLLAPDGSTVVGSQFCDPYGNGSINTGALPSSGTYTILLDPRQDTVMSFSVSARVQNAPAAPVSSASAAALPSRSSTLGLRPWIDPRVGASGQLARQGVPFPRHAREPVPARPARGLTRDQRRGLALWERSIQHVAETWRPTRRNRLGDWRTGFPFSTWTQLSPRLAAPGTTALAGQALTLNGHPLPGVTLAVEGAAARTQTDRTGRFLLTRLPAGWHVLVIDGATAGTKGRTYGRYEYRVKLTKGETTQLGFPIWMTQLDVAHATSFSSPTNQEVVATTPRIPGLEVRIPQGATIRNSEGRVVHSISITAVPVDRPPFPLPFGVTVPIYFTVQPGGAYIDKGAQIIYPNYTHLPPRQRVDFWNYDPDDRGWYVYGRGTVTANGKQVVPDPDVRVWEFTGAMINGYPSEAATGPKVGGHDAGGDPVDLQSGLFVYQHTDLAEPGPLPIQVDRTYRQSDPNSYSFGIGATLSYDLRLFSQSNYSSADLVLPDGGKVHYTRTSAGTGYSDAVYTADPTPSKFLGSTMTWNSSNNGWDLRLRDGTLYHFPEYAPLSSITDRFGNTVTLSRPGGPSGPITQIASSNGRWINLSYDGSNRIVKAQDSAGRSVSYTYDGSGHLATVTDANNGITKLAYDPATGGLTTITDPRNIVYLTNQYDQSTGRVSQQTLGDGGVYKFAYTTGSGGNVTQTDVTDPDGNINRTTFNAAGYSTGATLALGKAEQQVYTVDRDPATNRISDSIDALGRKTAYTYDANGNLASVTRLAGTSDAVTTSYSFDPASNRLSSVTDPLNHTTSLGYDGAGDPTSVTDALQQQTTLGYSSPGLLSSITDPLGHKTTFTYLAGDVSTITDPLGEVTGLFVDAAGRSARVTDPLGFRHKSSFDPLNDPTKITDPDGNQTVLSWDPDGDLTSVTDADNHASTYSYDNVDRVISRTDPLLRKQSYSYDKAGKLVSYTDRRGQVTTYQYDALGRLTFVGYGTTTSNKGVNSYASTIAYTWDAGNRLTKVVDSTGGTITNVYDGLDRLTSQTQASTAGTLGTVGYTYDAAGRRQSMTVAGQPTVNYTYDAANRLTNITQGASSVTIAYDAANRPTSLTLPNGVTATYGYDDANHLTSIVYSGAGGAIGDLNYAYDSAGQRTAVWGTLARTGLPAALASTATGYDADNELTKWGSSLPTYDAEGNLVNDGTLRYTWNARGELASIASVARKGPSATFTYDAYGRRQTKSVNGVTTSFLYDGPNVVQELSGSATPTANLLGGLGVDQLFGRSDGGGARSLLTDGLGSTLALTDAQGASATSYTYEPYGNATIGGAGSGNSFQYTGREADAIGNLDYYRARYYSPGLQRFISQDPAGLAGGVNRYAYTLDDPVDATDPSGLFSLPDVASALADGGAQLLSGVKRFLATPAGTVLATGVVCGLGPELCPELIELEADTLPAELGAETLPAIANATEEAAFPAIKAGAEGGPTAGKAFSQSVRQQALEENPSTCVFCHMETGSPQVDHAIARANGGNATLENAQTACPFCNASKGAREFPVNPPPGYEGPFPPSWWKLDSGP